MQHVLGWHQVLCVCWLRGTFPGSALVARDPSSLSSSYFPSRLCWHTVKRAAQAAIFPSFPPRFLSSPCQHIEMVLITSSLPDSWGLTPYSDASNICYTLFIIYNDKSGAEFLFWSYFKESSAKTRKCQYVDSHISNTLCQESVKTSWEFNLCNFIGFVASLPRELIMNQVTVAYQASAELPFTFTVCS